MEEQAKSSDSDPTLVRFAKAIKSLYPTSAERHCMAWHVQGQPTTLISTSKSNLIILHEHQSHPIPSRFRLARRWRQPQ
jgi:hypothetical protein